MLHSPPLTFRQAEKEAAKEAERAAKEEEKAAAAAAKEAAKEAERAAKEEEKAAKAAERERQKVRLNRQGAAGMKASCRCAEPGCFFGSALVWLVCPNFAAMSAVQARLCWCSVPAAG